jgi:chromosome partitioning protein
MAKVIAIYNFKGGVGKTATTFHLAQKLSKSNKVLVIDCDPQISLSNVILRKSKDTGTDIFQAVRNSIHNSLPYAKPSQITRNFHLLRGSTQIIEMESNSQFIEFGDLLMEKMIKEVEKEYDFVLIDCPSYFGKMVKYIIGNSNGLLIPMNPDILSLKSVIKLLNLLKTLDFHRSFKIIGIFMNRYKSRLLYHQKIRAIALKLFGKLLMDQSIRSSVRISESLDMKFAIKNEGQNVKLADDYGILCRQIIDRMDLLKASSNSITKNLPSSSDYQFS